MSKCTVCGVEHGINYGGCGGTATFSPTGSTALAIECSSLREQLTTTREIARELAEYVRQEKIYRSTAPAIIGDAEYVRKCKERDLTRRSLDLNADELLARAAGILNAPAAQPKEEV